VLAVQYIICIKGSEGSMLVSSHASTVYAVKNKLKDETNLADCTFILT